ncbi:hypothetical protein B7494_g7128 [Chlorociboria aeruginascens]|nr:hypothetical protein B7494_g7128 [Chlorociboria aeruginascens]
MNGNMDKGRRAGGMRRMRMDNILGDPFALATISIALLAWFIALVGSAIATADNLVFFNYSWFTVAYMLCCILGVLVVIASDTVQTYHVAIVGFLATGLVLTTSTVNSTINHPQGSEQATAAGHILLSIVNVIWIFYFGSTPSAVPRAYLDSFALHKDHRTSQNGRGMNNGYGSGRPDTSISSNVPPQMYTSAQLGGFETSSPVAGFQGGAPGATDRTSTPRFGPTPVSNLGTSGPLSSEPTTGEVAQPTEYPYRAKAIYSYDANPDDANEISFSKHEILEVSDVSGRWWQAKKENGDTGIAPSNYLILL